MSPESDETAAPSPWRAFIDEHADLTVSYLRAEPGNWESPPIPCASAAEVLAALQHNRETLSEENAAGELGATAERMVSAVMLMRALPELR